VGSTESGLLARWAALDAARTLNRFRFYGGDISATELRYLRAAALRLLLSDAPLAGCDASALRIFLIITEPEAEPELVWRDAAQERDAGRR
jgi:hypothetical protein